MSLYDDDDDDDSYDNSINCPNGGMCTGCPSSDDCPDYSPTWF